MEMESGTMPDRAWQLLRTGVALKNHRSRLLALGLLLLMSGCGGGGGGGGGGTCTPAPAISSSPPTTAEVGRQYQYVVAATHLCGDLLPFVCGNVDAIQLPSGAILNNPPPYVTWTPSVTQANTDAAFKVATVPDPCGNRVVQSWSVHVAPDTTPPTIVTVWPGNLATNVGVNTSITVLFSEPVNPISITPTSFLVSGPTGSILGKIAVFSSSATFTPTANLPGLSAISITLTTGIKDLSGNALTANYSWTFSTGASPPSPPPGWTRTTVDNGVVVSGTSIALDRLGRVYIAYQDGRFTGSLQQVGDVKLATNVSGAWQTTIADNIAPDVYASISTLINTLDASPHVAYYNFTKNQLKQATNASGSWVSDTVDSNAQNVTTVSMTQDAAGHLHLVYNPNGNVTHVTNAAGAWVSEIIGSNGVVYGGVVTCAIALDPSNIIHVAYYYYGTHELRHVTNASGAWVTDTIDNSGDVGLHLSIVSDISGKMHLSYYDATNGHLKYATNASGAWVTQTVDAVGNVGMGTGIALDGAGHVYISYTDATNHALKYATNASGPWQSLTIDKDSYVDSYTSIAVDPMGKAHIGYRGDGFLRYMTN